MAGTYKASSSEMNVPSTAYTSNNHFDLHWNNSGHMVKPKKPTPLNLYLDSRMEELTAQGKTKDEAFKIMLEEEKVLWILQALKKEPVYIVQHT